ncbi:flavohemoglobin expression-modulating QEGLA motif protein [Candidatus Auribacterota bacterium]
MSYDIIFMEQDWNRITDTICGRLVQNKRVRRKLPGGRINIDRPLPFICVFRQSPFSYADGTERLVTGEASYIAANADNTSNKKIADLLKRLAEVIEPRFGGFLIIEVWSRSSDNTKTNKKESASRPPSFRIITSAPVYNPLRSTLHRLQDALKDIRGLGVSCEAEIVYEKRPCPGRFSDLIAQEDLKTGKHHVIGLEVDPVYYDEKRHRVYPIELQKIRRGVSSAMKKTFFEFIRARTPGKPPHYFELGKRAVVKAVWETDARLANVEELFDFLLLSTPVNTAEARNKFLKSGRREDPDFYYRPLPVDPVLLKRQLYNIPIERVEDPALEHLFREKQAEINHYLTMLMFRETRKYLYGSIQLYGTVDRGLLRLAHRILKTYPQEKRRRDVREVCAREFRKLVLTQIRKYGFKDHALPARVHVSDDISGMVVVKGSLYIDSGIRLRHERVNALIQHEVSTHLLTYYNALEQPFRLLRSGFAGYEELQEGIGVISEFMTGGLTQGRLRVLAGRVIAADSVIAGASFTETFRLLCGTYGFTDRKAFDISMRVHRSGGLTKDCIYLRGLVKLLDYFKSGEDITPLLIGKYGFSNIPLVKELIYRNIIKMPARMPFYMEDAEAKKRLEFLRSGITVFDLVMKKGGRK